MRTRHTAFAAAFVAVGLVSFAAGTLAQGRFPEINRAEISLRNALAHLQGARNVFGGHKVRAERLINEAIGELQAGKAWAAQHGR